MENSELPPHRKQVKHFDLPGHLHELTFSCYQRLPLLRPVACSELLAQSLYAACNRLEVRLLAYVFMPEHVHLLVLPLNDDLKMEDFLYAVKRPMSFRAKQYFMEHHPDFCHARLIVQERPGKQSFRFWQEGPGYDRNIYSKAAIDTSIDYIHANPVRRGLAVSVEEWPWSSWHAYHTPDSSIAQRMPKVHTEWNC